MPHSKEDIKYAHTLELRFYRGTMMILMAALTAVAGYIATTTVNTSSELPAIKQELTTLNFNFSKLQDLPSSVQSNKTHIESTEKRVDQIDMRITWLEHVK